MLGWLCSRGFLGRGSLPRGFTLSRKAGVVFSLRMYQRGPNQGDLTQERETILTASRRADKSHSADVHSADTVVPRVSQRNWTISKAAAAFYLAWWYFLRIHGRLKIILADGLSGSC